MARSLLLSVPAPTKQRLLGRTRHFISSSTSLAGQSRIGCVWRSNSRPTGKSLVAMAAVSEFPREQRYTRIKSDSTGPIPAKELLQVAELAAKAGAAVVMESVNKPRNITYKGVADLVTEWNYEFCTRIEFVGGPMCWNTRTFSASASGGAFCNGQKIHVSQTEQVERSLLVTGFGYEHDEAWAVNIELFKEFTDISRGVRRLGAAAVDMSHVALGIVEAYWEYRLKPWDLAAGVLIVEEAGGTVTRMDGGDFTVFDRSVLVSNGRLHGKLLEKISPPTEKLISDGIDMSRWFKPQGYATDF